MPWIVDGASLAARINLAGAVLINDLEASAYGIALLEPSELFVLQSGGAEAAGNAAIISAGTGLGEAGLFWDGCQHVPFATEGGHASFSPENDFDLELLRWMRRQWQHVSWERVLSGPGLENIYRFLRDSGRAPEPPWLRDEMLSGDAPATIARAADAGCEIAATALDCFVRYYGAEAGNLALKTMARGGVYLGGGIAPKHLAKLSDGTFLKAFVSKGRMQSILETVPLRVIVSENLNLLGAARCAVGRGGAVATSR
ncbi:MAG: glucokinase [Deltaproteobacteria bacterium]|nr:glucokinase [Deltaproteobacteria bacterium]